MRPGALAATLLVCAVVSRVEACPCAGAELCRDARAEVERVVREGEVVGLGIAVIEHGRTSCTAAFGTADGNAQPFATTWISGANPRMLAATGSQLASTTSLRASTSR